MTRRIGAKALGDQLYSYIGAIQDLATAVREDLIQLLTELEVPA